MLIGSDEIFQGPALNIVFFFFCAVSYELDISSFFVKKVCFSVFVLNSVEDKGPRFISGKKFHLMVTVSFPFRIQI